MIQWRAIDVRTFFSPVPIILVIFLFYFSDTATVKPYSVPPVFQSSTNLIFAPLVWFERVYVDEQFGYGVLRERVYRKAGLFPWREGTVTPKVIRGSLPMLQSLFIFHKLLVYISSSFWVIGIFFGRHLFRK